MKRFPQLSASALPTVLVIGTLMLLATLALLSLSDIGTTLTYRHRSQEQKEAWLDAAFLLCERDSTLFGRLDETGSFVLFEDDPRSEVTVSREMWGLYELVKVSADKGKIRKVRLMGYAAESPKRAAMYVRDNQRAFTLAGESNIKGEVYLPENGLLYGQVQSDFYSGDRLPEDQIRRSSMHFPPLNLSVQNLFRRFAAGTAAAPPLDKTEMRTGFFDPIRYVQAESLSGVILYGHIAVCSDIRIEVDSASRLEEVILIAPKVMIGEGFSGTLQIIASDSVSVGKGVRLKYPSGILIPAGTADSFIEIEKNCEINGYVIFRSATDLPDDKRTAQYFQREKSRVRGLVWVDGIAEIHGTVTGSLYVDQANYYTPQGYYMNLLYNASVYRSEAMAFPLWMQSEPQRKTMKWLY